jgi:tetratricopeptide (TPR) repeat protein
MMRSAAATIIAIAAAALWCPILAQETRDQTMDAFTSALGAGRLVGSMSAMDLLQKLKATLSPDDWADAKESLLTELVRRGDRVISRYTSGDEVPQQKNDYDDCAAWFQAASELESSPRSESRMLFCRGRSSLASRDFTNAIKSLTEAVKTAGDEAFLYNALGVAYLVQGRNEDAATQFNEAIKREPAWTYPRHNLALTFMETGRYDLAQKWYQYAIAADERNGLKPGYLHYNLGLLEHQLGSKKEAQQEYQAALALFREQKGLNRQRASQLEKDNRLAEAGAAADRAASFQRDEAQAHNALGALWASQGKIKQAADAYREALSLNPDLTAARHNLELLQNRGKHGAASKKSTLPVTGSAGEFRPEE